ncbi:carboxyl transferase domain-containing protein [Amycolatopsis jiangsuensis]|uniref:Acetyl-coenzyme A carboxylase carboxyl transferase subunits beta/alpha n=1 Tax=Amycolatopsis jiangsuensis TaxID=1181879 RepID=A0A840IZS7_9PSEU|nr:carboxyl transferase domain-containing protein [Amycolatopsis jiangsuensis]MBB4686404.1 acetyl-CoA carboxylase carboxyl transferase subunit beta [Amycolatopsis jiangsuensis]
MTTARELIAGLAGTFTELPVAGGEPDDPIGWPGYPAARAAAAERTGETESVVVGEARVGDVPAVLIAWEFGFLGGSVGQQTGDRIEAAFTRARDRNLPVVSLLATGGSRMQHGMRALSQLQRIARASAAARADGVAQLSVLRNPTTGGGWATLGAGSDVTLGMPLAQVGFAGSRVRPATSPSAAYTAEAKLEWGQLDSLVEPDELNEVVTRWLQLLTSRSTEPAPPPNALRAASLPETGWDAVQAARASTRPRAAEYLDAYFDWREGVQGDRAGGVDAGVLCGFGWRDGRALAYAAQCGTATRPAGFRTAARLVRTASRLGIPVLTLVDTPGAANDAEAEQAGVGPAIAELFEAMAAATVPITSLVIGEGGSGGALAFAAPEATWMTPDAYFSVTSPEAAAAILKRPLRDVPEIAEGLRVRPQDLVGLGLARGIVRP